MRYLHVRNVLKTIFDFYIKSSIHVALSVLSLSKISLFVLGSDGTELLLIFIFFAALSAYNFIKFFPLLITKKISLEYRLILLLTLAGILTCITAIFYLPLKIIFFVLIGSFFVIGYSIPFQSKTSNWRNRKGWKIYLVVLSWVCLTVGVPLAYPSSFEILLFIKLAVLQGIYILVAIIPFEIGDLESDNFGLQTLPQKFGILNAKKMGLALLVGGYFVTVGMFGFSSVIAVSTLITFVLLGIGLWGSHKDQSVYYARFWVESIPILWCFIIHYF